jgi:hypothetical protein
MSLHRSVRIITTRQSVTHSTALWGTALIRRKEGAGQGRDERLDTIPLLCEQRATFCVLEHEWRRDFVYGFSLCMLPLDRFDDEGKMQMILHRWVSRPISHLVRNEIVTRQ